MEDQFQRTRLLLGDKGMEILGRSKVAVFGIGGVGGYVAEALARSGVGALTLVDSDRVSLTNINRQIIATHSSIGQYKVDVMEKRIHDINPDAFVEARRCFYLPENAQEFDFSQYSYVVDAVDTVTAKLEIILQAKKCGVPVISSMGAGNKLDPAAFRVADIYDTKVCPLARIMRRELKHRGVDSLKVVYSEEKPLKPLAAIGKDSLAGEQAAPMEAPASGRRDTPGSVAFVPSVAGLILAGEVVKDLLGFEQNTAIRLETRDLILKKAEYADWSAIYHNLWRHEESAKYMLWNVTRSEEEAKKRMDRTVSFEKKEKYALLVYLKETGQAIGFAGMRQMEPQVFEELGIALGPDYVGRGYGKQILNALIGEAARCGGTQFYASARDKNTASRNLIKSCGFSLAGSPEEKTDPRNGERYVLEKYVRDI